MTILDTLLSDLPEDWRVIDVYVGENWVLSLVVHDGLQRAGIATAPVQFASDARFQKGHYLLDEQAAVVAKWLLSPDLTAAAVGMATVNALNQPPETLLSSDDAADWLAQKSTGFSVAIFGRFPFIDEELRPITRHLWVFEQQPQAGEFNIDAIMTVLPQADVVAITGGSIVNHTIDLILPHVRPDSIVVLLGPSTPLAEKLFESRINAMFGVRVENVQQVIDSVVAGDGFQKMKGLQRVALIMKQS